MPKLTLSVDAEIVARAKRYAARQGTSVSRLVEGYLGLLGGPQSAEEDLPPITRRLAGVLKGSRASREDYRRYLERRHR